MKSFLVSRENNLGELSQHRLGYRLNDWGSIPGRSKEGSFALCHRVQTDSGTHSASYPTANGDKVAGASS